VVIKVFFTVLVLCTAAVVAVGLAIHFRVKRHLREQAAPNPAPEGVGLKEPIAAPVGPGEARSSGDAGVEEKRPE
jgi:hypothetical protein